MLTVIKTILLVVLIGGLSNARAGIFKCQDASGKTSYQETPCADGAKPVKSAVGGALRPKSNLPCDLENVNRADKKLAVYMLVAAIDSYSSLRSGGGVDNEIGKLRKASAEAGSIPVPECMEHGRDVLRKHLDLMADRLSARSKGYSFESADTRSANLKAEYAAAIDEARRQAREPTNVWAAKEK